MRSENLPAIETVLYTGKGSTIQPSDIFQSKSLFLKPVASSRKTGCYTLAYDKNNDNYQLFDDSIKKTDPDDIIEFINERTIHTDYLVQPLLENADSIRKIHAQEGLVTIRWVTACHAGNTHSLSAIAELPTDWLTAKLLIIDVTNGTMKAIEADNVEVVKNREDQSSKTTRATFPSWKQLKEVAEQAHKHFHDVATIGWDLALTPSGVKLLEGNTNWNVTPHQLHDNALAVKWGQFYFSKADEVDI